MEGLRRRLRAGRVLQLLVLVLTCLAGPGEGRADELATAVYVRTDSDKTVVIAPRLRAQVDVAETTRANAVYAVDVWTSASIDIMTSASQVPVTEQRDEIDFSVDHETEDVIFTVAYRYSTEPDYVSHGVSGGFAYDFADNNATLALGLNGSADDVGKAGDPLFSRSVGTQGARLSFTQVFGHSTLGQLIYETARASGYQASPYRFVAIGGDGTCTSAARGVGGFGALCVPEVNPGTRLRHAFGAEIRHAFSDHWSVGAAYRFYLDDWGVNSHTVRGEIVWSADVDTLLALRYRLYTQGKADHYQAAYFALQEYVTSDKELSPLSSHRVALELDRTFDFPDDRLLTTTLSFAPIFFSYSDFIPLDSITAFEINAALVLTL
jgi:hypothetical protein